MKRQLEHVEVKNEMLANIHGELAKTVAAHKFYLKRYFTSLEEKDDVHTELAATISSIRQTSKTYPLMKTHFAY